MAGTIVQIKSWVPWGYMTFISEKSSFQMSDFLSMESINEQIHSYLDFALWCEKREIQDYELEQRMAFEMIEQSCRNFLAREEEELWNDLTIQFEEEEPIWMVRYWTTIGVKLPAKGRECNACNFQGL